VEQRKNKLFELSLSQNIKQKERAHSKSVIKIVLKRKQFFILGYILALIALTIVVYWSLIEPTAQTLFDFILNKINLIR
jgi:hypothetical protein